MLEVKRLFFNTIFNVISKAAVAVIGFFIIPFMVGTLGEAKYGLWILIASIFSYRNTLTLGLNSSVNRYIPIYLVQSDKVKINKVIFSAFIYLLAVSFILLLITVSFFLFFEKIFSISPNLLDDGKNLILIIGFGFALAMPFHLFSGILSGLQRYDIISFSVLCVTLLRTFSIIILLNHSSNILVLGFVFIFCEILIGFIQLHYSKKLLSDFSMAHAKFDFGILKEMLFYGINTILYIFATAILCKSSDILIGIFIGTPEVAKYYVVIVIILVLSMFVESFSAAIKPLISDLDAKGHQDRIKQIALFYQKCVLVFILPVILFLVFFGKNFLQIWLSNKFKDYKQLYIVLVILVIGHFFRLIQYTNFMVLVGKGLHRLFGVFAVFMAVISICLSVFSLAFTDSGIIGVALSNSIALILVSGLILPFYFNYKMNFTYIDKLKNVWTPALLSLLPFLLISVLVKLIIVFNTWLNMMTFLFIFTVVIVLSIWTIAFSKEEKKIFYNIFAEKSGRANGKN